MVVQAKAQKVLKCRICELIGVSRYGKGKRWDQRRGPISVGKGRDSQRFTGDLSQRAVWGIVGILAVPTDVCVCLCVGAHLGWQRHTAGLLRYLRQKRWVEVINLI